MNFFKSLFLFPFVTLLFITPQYGATDKLDVKIVKRGSQLYQQYCQVCHQENGVGETPIPWSLRRPGYFPAIPLNADSHAWHHDDEQLVRTILEGPGPDSRMPAWKEVLSQDQAKDIVTYIKSLWPERIRECQGAKHMNCM